MAKYNRAANKESGMRLQNESMHDLNEGSGISREEDAASKVQEAQQVSEVEELRKQEAIEQEKKQELQRLQPLAINYLQRMITREETQRDMLSKQTHEGLSEEERQEVLDADGETYSEIYDQICDYQQSLRCVQDNEEDSIRLFANQELYYTRPLEGATEAHALLREILDAVSSDLIPEMTKTSHGWQKSPGRAAVFMKNSKDQGKGEVFMSVYIDHRGEMNVYYCSGGHDVSVESLLESSSERGQDLLRAGQKRIKGLKGHCFEKELSFVQDGDYVVHRDEKNETIFLVDANGQTFDQGSWSIGDERTDFDQAEYSEFVRDITELVNDIHSIMRPSQG